MTYQSRRSIIAENLRAGLPSQFVNQTMSSKKKMCWKCQKDKTTSGGHIKAFTGGPMKFICKECMDAKRKDVKP